MKTQKRSKIRKYFPSFSKIYASLRLRSKEYLTENTLHGIPYFVNPRRPKWERIAWFVCTMASIAACIDIILTIMKQFRMDPTLVDLETMTNELVTYFPSITLCQENITFDYGIWKSDAEHLDEMYLWSYSPLKTSPSKELNESYSSLFFRSAPNCSDLYSFCVVNGSPVPCATIVKKILGPRGICCYFDTVEITADTEVIGLSFQTDAYPLSMDVLEHQGWPTRRRDPVWYHFVYGLSITLGIQFTYSENAIAGLHREERKCLVHEEAPSYNICYHRCQATLIVEHCGCLPWFMTSALKRYPECTRHQYDCLAANSAILVKPECDCYLSCNHSAYDLDILAYNASQPNTISIMAEWPSLMYRREVLFGSLDLLVSFGGIAGLFVGYSILTTVEFVYYFSLRALCGAILTEDDKTIRIKVVSAKKRKRRVVKVIDIKNEYYNYVN